MGCGHDQPGVFPRVAGISSAYGVEWGGMEYKRLGGWASVQLGDEFCVSSSCLLVRCGGGIRLMEWLLNLRHGIQSVPHQMVCLFALFPLCISTTPSSPFCLPIDMMCPGHHVLICSSTCASLCHIMDIRIRNDALSPVVSLRIGGMTGCHCN